MFGKEDHAAGPMAEAADVIEKKSCRSQFKRSALPNAPKVGSGGSLSPRSDWRAPSDGHADAWLQELERDMPDA
jgi:hypothetical protein